MFDEPSDGPAERPIDPKDRAREKADEFRMHAELAAVFEGTRKFDARICTSLTVDVARHIQLTMGRLEKAKSADHPILPPSSTDDAIRLLTLPDSAQLATNDYHLHRRPGEVMMVRWLAGAEVDTFYERLGAHFEAAMNMFREEERQSLGWKQDPPTQAYLDALDKLEMNLSQRYLRPIILQHSVVVLSTQTADEMDIVHLCDYVMGVEAAAIVGSASAPPEEPTEGDRAWFFKLFSLRGMSDGIERMCFFTYLQKTEESAW